LACQPLDPVNRGLRFSVTGTDCVHADTWLAHAPSCRAEKRAAERTRKDLERILSRADAIAPKVHGYDRYDKTMTELVVDGEPLHWHMIRAGNAVPYADGKRIDWCKRLRGRHPVLQTHGLLSRKKYPGEREGLASRFVMAPVDN